MTVQIDAKLALAADDREGAAEAARKLIPNGPLSPETADSIGLVAQLVEELDFPKAADKLYAENAELTARGILSRAAFLGRQQRTDEALTLLETAWEKVPMLEILGVGVGIIEANGLTPSETADQRLLDLCLKAQRVDPESKMIVFLQGVIMELIGRQRESIIIYRELLATPDLDPVIAARASNNLAGILVGTSELAEAKELIESAAGVLGPHPAILDTQGLIWLARGDTTRAMEALKDALLAPSASTYLHSAVAAYDARMSTECRAALIDAEKKGLRKQRLTPIDRERLAKLDKALAEQVDR
jgi:tetratricopeptide (TPR) repeat protein